MQPSSMPPIRTRRDGAALELHHVSFLNLIRLIFTNLPLAAATGLPGFGRVYWQLFRACQALTNDTLSPRHHPPASSDPNTHSNLPYRLVLLTCKVVEDRNGSLSVLRHPGPAGCRCARGMTATYQGSECLPNGCAGARRQVSNQSQPSQQASAAAHGGRPAAAGVACSSISISVCGAWQRTSHQGAMMEAARPTCAVYCLPLSRRRLRPGPAITISQPKARCQGVACCLTFTSSQACC